MLILINDRRLQYMHTGIFLPGVRPTSSLFLVVTLMSAFPEWCFKTNTLYCHTAVIMSIITTITHTAGFHPLMTDQESEVEWYHSSAAVSYIHPWRLVTWDMLLTWLLVISTRCLVIKVVMGVTGKYQQQFFQFFLVFQSMNDWFYFMFGCLQEPSLMALFKDIDQQQTKYKHNIQIKINRQTNRIYIYASVHVS